MDTTTLEKANDLNRRIIELTEAIGCFEWPAYKDQPSTTRRPSLIIEFDGDDGREQSKLPIELNNDIIELLKVEMRRNRQLIVDEFNKL